MRPAASTSVISIIVNPAPDTAIVGTCAMCQSDATPSSALYWHIGETTMRFLSASVRNLSGENSLLAITRRLSLPIEPRAGVHRGANAREIGGWDGARNESPRLRYGRKGSRRGGPRGIYPLKGVHAGRQSCSCRWSFGSSLP